MKRSSSQKILIILAGFVVFWLGIRYLLPIFLPFLLAFVLALAAEPLVVILEKRLHLPRGLSSGIGVVVCLLLAVLAVLSLCALLLKQLGNLTRVLPDLESTALSGMDSLEGYLLSLAERTPPSVQPILTHGVEGVFSDGSMVLDRVVGKLLSLASGILSQIPDSALGFGTWVLASFMISAKLPQIRQYLAEKTPRRWKEQYFPAMKRLKKNLLGWLLAQTKLMGITFLVLCGGFLLLRISYAPLWAFLISLVDALPVLGTGTVLIPWSLICFLQGDLVQGAGILGIYLVAVLLRSVLEPKFVGRQLGLDPLVTLLAMYAGYRLWGILGMLVSPLLAITATQLFSVQTSGE